MNINIAIKKIRRLSFVSMAALIILLLNLTTSLAYQNVDESHPIALEDTVYLYLETGTVVIQLTPAIAPNHVSRFKSLVSEGFYNGLDFYRVIDGFVAQAGDIDETKSSSNKKPMPAEFTRSITSDSSFMVVQSPEFLAEQTGFIGGFPAGRSLSEKQEWLIHCSGTVAMARNNEADSATTEFYIVIGQAPRHLDRNMSIFGQVVYGMQHVQFTKRGDRNKESGMIDAPANRTKILSAKLGSQVPDNQRVKLSAEPVSSTSFQQRLKSARELDNPFFHYKGTGNLDVCYYRPNIKIL